MTTTGRYVSADGHVVEPADLWTTRMDQQFRDRAPRVESPSTYFKRQFWATFEDNWAGILTRELIGVDRLMWGSDYPHTEGTFPYSQEQIMKDLLGVPEDEAYKMVAGNAASLYGLSV